MRRITFLFLAFVFTISLPAQPGNWRTYVDLQKINDYLDEPDTLWLATDAGLLVVDKNSLEITQLTKQSAGLPSNQVESITREPQTNRLFIGTYDMALAVRMPEGWQPIPLPDDLEPFGNQPVLTYCLEFDGEGKLWVGTNSGILRRNAGGDWTVFNELENFNFLQNTWKMTRDADGNLLMAAHIPVKVIDGEPVPLVDLNTASQMHLFAYGDADIYYQSDSSIWFFTDVGAAGRYDGEHWEVHSPFQSDEPNFSTLQFLTEDPDGQLWAYVGGHGFFREASGEWLAGMPPAVSEEETPLSLVYSGDQAFVFGDQESRVWQEGQNTPLTLTDYPFTGALTDFTYDAEGRLWAIDDYRRLRCLDDPALDLAAPGGEDTFIRDFAFDSDGELWILQQKTVYHQTADGWETFDHTNSNLPDAYGLSRLTIEPSGQVWLARPGHGLYRYNGEAWHYLYHPLFQSESIFAMTAGAAGEVWLILYHQNSGARLARYDGSTLQLYAGVNSPVDPEALYSLFYEKENQRLWMAGGTDVLQSFDGEQWEAETIPLPAGAWVRRLWVRDGLKVLSTSNSMLLFDEETWTVFDADNAPLHPSGLSDFGLDQDRQLWISHYNQPALEIYDTGWDTPTSDRETGLRQLSLTLAPNPAQDLTWLSYTLTGPSSLTAQLLTTDGRRVRDVELPAGPGTHRVLLSLEGLPAGLYWLQLRSPQGTEVMRVVKM